MDGISEGVVEEMGQGTAVQQPWAADGKKDIWIESLSVICGYSVESTCIAAVFYEYS